MPPRDTGTHIDKKPLPGDIAIVIISRERAGVGYTKAIWDMDDDPAGNVLHVAAHGITKEEVEEVLENPDGIETSRSSGHPIAFGETSGGRLIAVVYEEVDEDTVYPVTAYEVE